MCLTIYLGADTKLLGVYHVCVAKSAVVSRSEPPQLGEMYISIEEIFMSVKQRSQKQKILFYFFFRKIYCCYEMKCFDLKFFVEKNVRREKIKNSLVERRGSLDMFRV
jgi:hypothetical protein